MRSRCLHCFLFGLLALLSAGFAQAACESGLAERMHAKLHPKRTLDGGLAACKPWPAYPGRSIVVLPLVNSIADGNRKILDLEVLVIQRPDNGNTERDAVLARLYQSEALEEDAIRVQDIRIDTARYVLSPEARAFGLQVRYLGSSRSTPYTSETLRLYVPQGARLHQVLDEIEIDRDSGEWDMQCNGSFERLRTLLSVGRAKGGDYADLTLSRTITESRARAQKDGQCETKSLSARSTTVVLRHDGKRYGVPKSLRGNP